MMLIKYYRRCGNMNVLCRQDSWSASLTKFNIHCKDILQFYNIRMFIRLPYSVMLTLIQHADGIDLYESDTIYVINMNSVTHLWYMLTQNIDDIISLDIYDLDSRALMLHEDKTYNDVITPHFIILRNKSMRYVRGWFVCNIS